MRDQLTAHGLPYAVGIRLQTAVWCDDVRQDQPLSVLELACTLPPASYRTISWREGTKQRLSSRFARIRVRAAHGRRDREEEWLLIECGTHVPWPKGAAEPTRYFLSTLPEGISFKKLVAVAKMRRRIERDYLELKQEVGLGHGTCVPHYEGRNWRGFHHHASLCIAAYGFLMLERLRGRKKKLQSTPPRLAYPEASSREGLGPMQRHIEWSIATVRFELARAIAQRLAHCPYCGRQYARAVRT